MSDEALQKVWDAEPEPITEPKDDTTSELDKIWGEDDASDESPKGGTLSVVPPPQPEVDLYKGVTPAGIDVVRDPKREGTSFWWEEGEAEAEQELLDDEELRYKEDIDLANNAYERGKIAMSRPMVHMKKPKDEGELKYSEEYVAAARIIARDNGADVTDYDTDEKAADYLLNEMSSLDYNTVGMGKAFLTINEKPEEVQKAWHHAIKMGTKTDVNAQNFMRATLQSTVKDPMFYGSLGTAALIKLLGAKGVSWAAKLATKSMIEQNLTKEAAKKNISKEALLTFMSPEEMAKHAATASKTVKGNHKKLGAAVGGGYSTLFDVGSQKVMIDVNLRDEYDYGQMLTATALGSGAGWFLGGMGQGKANKKDYNAFNPIGKKSVLSREMREAIADESNVENYIDLRPYGMTEEPSRARKVLSFLKRTTANSAGLDRVLQPLVSRRRSHVKVAETIVKQTIPLVEKATKKEYGKVIAKEVWDDVDAGLRGDHVALNRLEPETRAAVVKMRNEVTAWQNNLLDSGAIEKGSKLEATIRNSSPQSGANSEGLHFYLTQSYEAFDNPNWPKELREKHRERIPRARNFLIQQSLEHNPKYRVVKDKLDPNKGGQTIESLTQGERDLLNQFEGPNGLIEGQLNEIINKAPETLTALSDILSTGVDKGYRSAGKILTKRGDIPEPIKMIMGLYDDPLTNYTKTIHKLVRVTEEHNFFQSLREIAEGGGLEGKAIISPEGPKGQTYVDLAEARGVPRYEGTTNPLKDMYATPEFVEALRATGELDPIKNSMAKGLLTAQAYWRLGKTVGAISAYPRNLMGAFQQGMANGYWVPSKEMVQGAFEAVRTSMAALYKSGDNDLNTFVTKAKHLEIFDADSRASQIREALNESLDDYWVDGGVARNLSKAEQAVKGAKKAGRKLLDIYQGADNIGKIHGFFYEQKRNRQILLDKGLDPDEVIRSFETSSGKVEITRLEETAANIVRDVLHNYNQTSRAVKYLRRAPLADFITYKIENFRTAKNILRQSLKDMDEGQKLMRESNGEKGRAQFLAGANRFGSFSGVALGPTSLTKASLYAGGFMGSQYFNGDEDNIKIQSGGDTITSPMTKGQALQLLSPEYEQANEYLYTGEMQGGRVDRFNMSYADNMSAWRAPAVEAYRLLNQGLGWEETSDRVAALALKNMSETIGVSGFVKGISKGFKEYNNPRNRNMGEKLAAGTLTTLEEVVPGSVKEFQRIFDAKENEGWLNKGGELLKINPDDPVWNLAGVRKDTFDTKVALALKAKKLSRNLAVVDDNFNSLIREFGSHTTPDEIVEEYGRTLEEGYDRAKEIWRAGVAAKTLGMDTEDIYKALTKDGYFPSDMKASVREAIFEDRYNPPQWFKKDLFIWAAYVKEKTGKTIDIDAVEKRLTDMYSEVAQRKLTPKEKKNGEAE